MRHFHPILRSFEQVTKRMAGVVRRIPLGMYGNNEQTTSSPQYTRENHGVQTPASKHCRLLEEFIKRQNLELAQKQRVHEEMRALIDWLKRDLSKAETRVRELEGERGEDRKEEEGACSDAEEDGMRRKENKNKEGRNREAVVGNVEREPSPEKKKLESVLEALNDRNQKIESLQEKLDDDEREIEDLQKENEGYYEQIRRLQTTIQRQEREMEIDREVEEEREQRLKDLVAENEDLRSQLSRLKHSMKNDC